MFDSIKMIIDGWSSTELRKKAEDELKVLISDLSKYEVRHEVDIRTIESLHNQVSGLTQREGDGATGYCECEVPEFAPFIECVKCGNPPRA